MSDNADVQNIEPEKDEEDLERTAKAFDDPSPGPISLAVVVGVGIVLLLIIAGLLFYIFQIVERPNTKTPTPISDSLLSTSTT